LKELYFHFKNSHPEVKVGFLKFASLHSRNCITAGASGTHNVCVYEQFTKNVKLMLEACKISGLTRSSEHHLFFRDCSECPGPTDFENTLEDIFTDNAIENITFKQWISTDRCELVTTVKSTEEFIELLLEKLLLLLRHSFIHWDTASYAPQRTEM
jgi:hypothetical protein